MTRNLISLALVGKGEITPLPGKEKYFENPGWWEEKRGVVSSIFRLPNKCCTHAACLQAHGLWSTTDDNHLGVSGDTVWCTEPPQFLPSPSPTETPQHSPAIGDLPYLETRGEPIQHERARMGPSTATVALH